MDEIASSIARLQRENAELRAAAVHNAERARRAGRLRALTAKLAASLDRAALFDEIVRAAADLLSVRAAGLLLLDEEPRTLYAEAGLGLEDSAGAPLAVDRTVAGRALRTRTAIALEDTASEPDTLFPTLRHGTRPGALITAPIRIEGKPFGVVEIYYDEPRAVSPEDVELLDALSDTAAIALRNATTYARILDQSAQLARRATELTRQQEKMARLNDELRRANVLKSQFLSNVSHELRTPLTSIIGFSSILLRGRRGEELSERQRDNTERILSAARRLVTIVNDVLDLSRIEAGRLDVFRREVDLRALLEGLRDELEPQARARGLELRVEIADDAATVVTDGDRLRQVLVNLAGNAVKFTPRGHVTLRAARTGDLFSVAVEDTGVGIPLDQQERIFEDFYQADGSSTRTSGGAGLGLAISRRLARLLEGRLTVYSVPEEGSTFTIVLQAGATPHAAAGTARVTSGSSAGPTRHGTARVLVIDDDPEMILLVEGALEGSRYDVVGALSANEGLQKARMLRPDAILLDVMMSEIDGWRTLHHLKQDPETASIPVVMHTIVADQALGFSLGATDYLVKPVEREQLLATLRRLRPVGAGPVLVVDDDEDIRVLLTSLLSDARIPVVGASGGEEALELVARHEPRLVLLDLMMPRMDGFAVLQRLRSAEATRHLPVIVVTAKTLTPEEEQLLNSEASMVVTKSGLPLGGLLDDIRNAVDAAATP